MSNVLSMTDLTATLAEQNNITKKAAKETIESVLALITAPLVAGDSVRLSGFGSLSVVEVAERKCRNPQTGAEIIVPPTKRVKFKVASALKASVVGETAE